MNKSFLFLVILILVIPSLFFYTACSDPGGEEEVTSFWATDMTDFTSYSLSADLRAEGTYCKVYVETTENISNSEAQNIADEFDNNIYSDITTAFGATSDVNVDGKITILILDIIDGYSGSGGYIGGYYDAYNLYDFTDSNKCDMIYIDCDPGDATDAYFIIAHELQHLICFNQKVLVQGNASNFDTWINEGLSAGAEYVYSDTISTSRINTYNADSEGYIEEGMNFETWFGELENYSTVYLFFQWIRLHASNGTNVYKEIIDQSEVDYIAVVNAVNSRIGDLSSANWDEILRNWFSANAFQASSGILGYEDEVSLTIHPLTGETTSEWPLYAGEGIYVAIAIAADEAMTPAGYIDYAGLDTTTDTIDTISSYSGDYLLCYNTEGTPAIYTSDYETTDPLPNIVFKYSAQQMQMINEAIANEPESYPIDIIVGQDIPKLFDSIKKRVK